MEPMVTIALPTYNRAQTFLRPAIECALGQDWENLEIIVSDNCSTDNTAEVVKSYSDKRLRYVRQEHNIGANNNFNFCISEAAGSYFLLFHDDDVIDSDLVSACMKAANCSTDFGLIRAGTRLIDGNGAVIRDIPNTAGGRDYVEFFRGWMRGEFTSYVCSTLFNTKLLREVGGFRSSHGLFQDMMVVAKLIARAGHCDVEAVRASFRRHEENYGNAADLRAWCEDGKELAQTIADEAPADGQALYSESMRYLCGTVYGYARRFIASPVERVRAYRMIQAEFHDCYPVTRYIYNQDIRRRYRMIRGPVRRFVNRMIGRQAAASR